MKEVFQARNWQELTPKDLKKLARSPQALSRYMAYQPLSKEAVAVKEACVKRVREFKRKETNSSEKKSKTKELETRQLEECKETTSEEKLKSKGLIGELRAATARGRLRDIRIRYESNRAREINHLITCQPTAQECVRLEAFIPPQPVLSRIKEPLKKQERLRCEAIMEDDLGLTVNRLLT
ncbi:uncharacterized protein LOC134195660 isoform X2 [Corticium candelabrum]|nr:uncharacterized protein LOC134195660 isoform X2 [Corticium candelabrum]